MAVGSGVVSTGLKWWIVPTVVLTMVGVPALAVSWSNTFTKGVGTGAGIVVHDAPELVEHFQTGQDTAAGGDAPGQAPAPTDVPPVTADAS